MTIPSAQPRAALRREDKADAWHTAIATAAERRRTGAIGAAAFAAQYFLYWQIARHDERFAARKHRADPRPRPADWRATLDAADPRRLPACLDAYLDRHQFHGVSAAAVTALCQWLRGHWALALSETVPAPVAVLRAQARGKRVVTAITAYPRMLSAVLGKPDAFAFFLHDLEHAFKFFSEPALFAAQRAFFAALEAALDRDWFAPYLVDAVFAAKFDYLISDMNTHPQHGRQYLRAILIESCLRNAGRGAAETLAPPMRQAVERLLMALDAPNALVADA